MFKPFSSAFVAVAALSSTAHAANCSPHPYNLSNGTIADATQVMADFNNLLNCSNNNLAPNAYPPLYRECRYWNVYP